MSGVIPPLPQYFSMAWCLFKHRDNFTFMYMFNTFGGEHTDGQREFISFSSWKKSVPNLRHGAESFLKI
jgi:hypothetical protein